MLINSFHFMLFYYFESYANVQIIILRFIDYLFLKRIGKPDPQSVQTDSVPHFHLSIYI